jgi:hypothetical protein
MGVVRSAALLTLLRLAERFSGRQESDIGKPCQQLNQICVQVPAMTDLKQPKLRVLHMASTQIKHDVLLTASQQSVSYTVERSRKGNLILIKNVQKRD